MLVINANNQQDTTNYMLAEPWYPDTDSILMWGGPHKVRYITGSVTVTGDWINDSPIIDTIGTEPINFYCPKFYKSWLRQWNYNRTSLNTNKNWRNIPVDFWVLGVTTSNANIWCTITWTTWYRIAVKWLQAWQVIWEKIYAPIMFVGWCGDNRYQYISGSLTITFWLLHSDWTKTVITTITPTRVGGNFKTSASWRLLSNDDVNLNVVFADSMLTAIWAGSYEGVGATASDWDILYADVILWNNPRFWQQCNSSYIWLASQSGICYWGTNNNNPWDLNWFRPFQVSIRDS